MSDDIIIKENHVYGGWREQINIWQNAPDSIHNEEVAKNIGMRGGTIPGTLHLNLFPPLFLKIFGEQWFELGSISMYYTYATKHREKVRAVIEIPNDSKEQPINRQYDAWVETPNEDIVAKGTVSVGNVKESSYIQKINLVSCQPEDLKILSGLKEGQEMLPHEFTMKQDRIDKALDTICDPLDYYKGNSPWGNSILSPAGMYTAMMVNPKLYKEKSIKAVGFFGATELCNINGPIKVEIPYKATGKIICVGTSNKTEYFWYDSFLHEIETGKKIAQMRKMIRFMKISSPLYKKT